MGNTGHISSTSLSAPLPYSASPIASNNGPQFPYGVPNEPPHSPMNNNWGPGPGPSPSGPPQQVPYRPQAPLSNNNRVILPGKINLFLLPILSLSVFHFNDIMSC